MVYYVTVTRNLSSAGVTYCKNIFMLTFWLVKSYVRHV